MEALLLGGLGKGAKIGKFVREGIQVHSDGMDLIGYVVGEERRGVQDQPERPAFLNIEGVIDGSEDMVSKGFISGILCILEIGDCI